MAHPEIKNAGSKYRGMTAAPRLEPSYRASLKEHFRQNLIDSFTPMVDLAALTGTEEGQLSEQESEEAKNVVIKSIEDFSDALAQSIFRMCSEFIAAHFIEHVQHLHIDDTKFDFRYGSASLAVANDDIIKTTSENIDEFDG